MAEKRRLLEKAKMKGRKGKKHGKGAKNANKDTKRQYDSLDANDQLDAGDQSEEYLDDDGYDPIPMPAPPHHAVSEHDDHPVIPSVPSNVDAAQYDDGAKGMAGGGSG